MRIVYIHQYFKTPEEGGATRSFYLAKGLVQAGYEVDLITGGAEYYDLRKIEGITVHYLPVAYDQKFGFVKRVYSFLNFVKAAKGLIIKLPRPDLFYISSTPLTTGLIGLWAKKKFAIPYIFEVRDIWPEAPIQVGVIRNPVIKRYLRKIEKKTYRNALKLVGLSPGIVNHLRIQAPEREVHLIPNFSDPDYFFPSRVGGTDVSKKITIAYTGALGKVNALDELVDFAYWSQKEKKPWNFIIMGQGSEENFLKKKASKLNLNNLEFEPFGSKKRVNEVLAKADFAWISFADLPILNTNSPNKFFDAIAAGKAIIINHRGWVYRLVTENNLGFSILDKDWQGLSVKLSALQDNPKKLREMQQNAQRISEDFFTEEIAVKRLLHAVDSKKHPLTLSHEAYIRIA
ncbi:glycosyltransferase family 4 protein [Algoriphagus sp. C2-7]|uniref:Glycosyltransferase family 4 protein n=2 Tax=Algoriphagus sediminis TaxID=3057113 RepID=A0ABT7YC77_9BACT|nr:glycosyltransferase family 4 protein [Algoriphagus sediminis]